MPEPNVVSRRELSVATGFFALTALLCVVVFQPLGWIGWTVLLTSLGFVALGCLTLWKGEALAARGFRTNDDDATRRPTASTGGRTDRDGPVLAVGGPQTDIDAVVGEPSPEERAALESTLTALVDADLLVSGEVDVVSMWRAAQAVDPGHRVDVCAAFNSLAVLGEHGRVTLRRLVFVPVGTEYDATLVAEITAAVLTALGHDIDPLDVVVTLPADGSPGASTVAFPLHGRTETVRFTFLWKDPPPDLLEALARFSRAEDPREIVGADVDYQWLLYAAITPGSLDALNQRIPVEHGLFGPP